MNMRDNQVTVVSRTRNAGIKTYKLRWLVENFGFLRTEKLHRGPFIQIGNMVSEFMLFSTSTQVPVEPPRAYVFLGLVPSPTSKSLFTIMSPAATVQYHERNALELVPFLVNKGRFYGFRVDRSIVDLVVYCDIATIVRDRGDFLCKAIRVEERSTMKEDMKCLLRDERFCDIALQAGGRVFKAHRAILYARCPYFAEFLRGSHHQEILTFKDISSDSFEEILNYIYTGKAEKFPIEMALSLFPLSIRFQLKYLKLFLTELIIGSMSVEFALDLVMKAHRSHETALEECAIECIGNNLESAMKHETWPEFLSFTPLVEDLFQYVAKRFVKNIL